jgi:hypothetical protein
MVDPAGGIDPDLKHQFGYTILLEDTDIVLPKRGLRDIKFDPLNAPKNLNEVFPPAALVKKATQYTVFACSATGVKLLTL